MTAQQVPSRASSAGLGHEADRYRGTFRVCPPEETWNRIAPHLVRAGITRVTDHTGLDTLGIPVFAAVRPAAGCHHYALGKGVSPLLSRISACMEAIEVWHAETVTAEIADVARVELTAGYESALSPSSFAHPAGIEVGDRVSLDWVRGRSLGGCPVWVPHDAVRLDSRRYRLISASTNGLASGNTLDEAILHGLLEICERDAIATFLTRRQGRRIALSSVTDRECRALLDSYWSGGFDVELIDVTNDLGVPTVVAFVRSGVDDWIFCGAGAHLNAAVAASRALTEAAQLRLIVRLGIRDDVDDRFDASPGRTSMDMPDWITIVPLDDVAADETRSLSADVSHVADLLLRRRDLDPVVVDLTRIDTGIPVVKVVAPGAGEDLTFFAPRRSLPFPGTHDLA